MLSGKHRTAGFIALLALTSGVCGCDGGPTGPGSQLEPPDLPGWNWQNPLSQGNALYDVAVIDRSTAVAIGGAGTILRTTDAGESWELVANGTSRSLWGISFADSDTGTVLGSRGTILRTANGGATWSPQASAPGKVWERGSLYEQVKPFVGVQLVKVQPGQSRSGQASSESCSSPGDWWG